MNRKSFNEYEKWKENLKDAKPQLWELLNMADALESHYLSKIKKPNFQKRSEEFQQLCRVIVNQSRIIQRVVIVLDEADLKVDIDVHGKELEEGE